MGSIQSAAVKPYLPYLLCILLVPMNVGCPDPADDDDSVAGDDDTTGSAGDDDTDVGGGGDCSCNSEGGRPRSAAAALLMFGLLGLARLRRARG